jgi:hypothetical protein
MKLIETAVILLILSTCAVADGGSWVRYSYAEDKLSLVPEDRQYSFITYEKGVEELSIAVNIRLNGTEAYWILPLPAKAGDVKVDILSGFPHLQGYEVKSRVGYYVNQAYPWMVMSQGYPILLIIPIWQLGIFNMGGGGGVVSSGALTDSGIKVETHLEKDGLTVEVLEADSWNALENYLQKRGVRLPDESKTVIGEYIGKKYSFAVTWVSNVPEYTNSRSGGTLSLRTVFPTEKMFYPLRLTSVYGKSLVPVTIYLRGFTTPLLSSGMVDFTNVKYFVNEDGMTYTKVVMRTQAENFKEDIWIDNTVSPDIYVAYILGISPLGAPLLIYLISSCVAGLLAGQFVFGRRYSPFTYLKIGVLNFLTIVGVAVGANKLLKIDGENRKNWTLIAILILMPFAAIMAFIVSAYSDFLIYPLYKGLGVTPYSGVYGGGESTIHLVVFSILSMLLGKVIYLIIFGVAYLMYKRTKEKAWLIPTIWFGSLVLVGVLFTFIPLGISTLLGSDLTWNSYSWIYNLFIIPYALLVISLILMFFAGIILAVTGNSSIVKFCVIFSFIFTVLVLVLSFGIMSTYPPEMSTGGYLTSTGFAKIKPQLAGTGLTRDGEFMGLFTNGVGTKIRVNGVELEDLSSNSVCKGVFENDMLAAGDNLKVTAEGCGEGTAGNVYKMGVNINYDVTIGGTTTSHMETGTLRGRYE